VERPLEGKVIIVVGAGPGLGHEVARLAARDGAHVALAARNADRLMVSAQQIDPDDDRTATFAVDVTDQASCDALVAQTLARFGRVDGIAVVAAYVLTQAEAVAIEDDEWRTSFDVNVLGPLHMARAAVSAFESQGGGSIVLIGTQAAYDPKPGMAAYGTTKIGGQLGLMHYLAAEWGRRRVRVNTVETSWMLGPLVQGYMDMMAEQRGVTADEVIGEIAAGWPIPEMPLDDDVAEAVVFLLSNKARMITGQTIRVNAGEYLA
jgi:NAD(P)-dependent dehydrogenase (short-subunit alcohol dehydrogenase family)